MDVCGQNWYCNHIQTLESVVYLHLPHQGRRCQLGKNVYNNELAKILRYKFIVC